MHRKNRQKQLTYDIDEEKEIAGLLVFDAKSQTDRKRQLQPETQGEGGREGEMSSKCIGDEGCTVRFG